MKKGVFTVGPATRLSADDVVAVATSGLKVRLDPRAKRQIGLRRKQIVDYLEKQQEPAYGFNRGFGHNVDNSVRPENLAQLQRNVILSHSAGVGDPTSLEVVRGAMLLRAQSLAQGYSGVRAVVIEKLIELLNKGVTPCVPTFGSVGASGDLAPLSHIALALIGEGEGFDSGSSVRESIRSIFKRRKITPLVLEMKEGLALNNGVQFSNAMGIIAAVKLRGLLRTAVAATALSNQVMLGSDTAYDKDLLALRPHRGSQVVGRWLRELIKGSRLREVHRSYEVDGEVQDPYNLRCAPQILGTCYDLIEDAIATFEVEANSVTDNPLILSEKKNSQSFTRILSGGQFHGMPIAVKIYSLIEAMGIMARLSNMRCVRYVDQARNKGLPSDLVWPELGEAVAAMSSGMMIPEYVSAALTNVIWGAAMPSHLFSLSTDAGQEDHVSMSATLGARVLETIPRLGELLAIELAFGSQGAAIRERQTSIPTKHRPKTEGGVVGALIAQLEGEVKKTLANDRFEPKVTINLRYKVKRSDRMLSSVCEKLVSVVRETFPLVTQDRELSSDLKKLAEQVNAGGVLKAVEKHYLRR